MTKKLAEITEEYFDSVGITVHQSKSGHRYGAESLALADFIHAQKGDRVAELGSGSGVISLIIAKRDRPDLVAAVEVQEEMYKIALDNVKRNNLENIVTCINEDWREYSGKYKSSFDLVVANPPFYAAGSGRISENESRAKARHEINGTIADLARAASELLVPYGRFAVTFNSRRREELIHSANSANLAIFREGTAFSEDYFLLEFKKTGLIV